jgi:hypothetical protein
MKSDILVRTLVYSFGALSCIRLLYEDKNCVDNRCIVVHDPDREIVIAETFCLAHCPIIPLQVGSTTGELGSIIRWYGITHRSLDFETPPHPREISINDFQILIYRKPGIPFAIQPRKRSEFAGPHQIVN